MSHYTPNRIKRIYHSSRRFLAKNWLRHSKAIQIALTGSQGKTSTTHILKEVFQHAFGKNRVVVTDTNLDTIYNVPITALRVRPSTKFVIWELGIDNPRDMGLHLEIAKPHIAIITGIAPVHTDKEHLGSLEKLIQEKRKLIEHLEKNDYAVLNYEDEYVRAMAPYTKATILWYGTTPGKCDIWMSDVELDEKGTRAQIHEKDASSWKIQTSLLGAHQILNAMAAYAVYKRMRTEQDSKTSLQSIQQDFAQLIADITPLRGRLNLEKGPNDILVLNDARRANPTSTRAGLQTLTAMQVKGKKYAVLCEMGELQFPEEEHTKLGAYLATLNLDFVVTVGPMQKYTYEEALKRGVEKQKIYWTPSVIEAGVTVKKRIQTGDLLYLKGSHLRHSERVLLILAGKKVVCSATICPFYNTCDKCNYLTIGYQG